MSVLVFLSTCRLRQYGLWERYSELYPDADLVYTIGVSDYRKDWFYAQVPRSGSWNTDYLYNMAEDYSTYFILNSCIAFLLS
jgi:hypothetical protein